MKTYNKENMANFVISPSFYEKELRRRDFSYLLYILQSRKAHIRRCYIKIYRDTFLKKARNHSIVPLVILQSLLVLSNFATSINLISKNWTSLYLIGILYFLILYVIEILFFIGHIVYVTCFYQSFQRKIMRKIEKRNILIENKPYYFNESQTGFSFPLNKRKSVTCHFEDCFLLGNNDTMLLILGIVSYRYSFLPYFRSKKINMLAVKTTESIHGDLFQKRWKAD